MQWNALAAEAIQFMIIPTQIIKIVNGRKSSKSIFFCKENTKIMFNLNLMLQK